MADRDDARSNAEVVADAIRDGRIQPAKAGFWADALDTDPAGARSLLAMLTPMPDYARPAAISREESHNAVVRAPAAAAPGARVETLEELNARINADAEMQDFMWRLGVRDGIEPPPVTYAYEPEYEPPWDPKPQIVENADGSTEWIIPEPDYSGTMLADDSPDSPRSAARTEYQDWARRANAGDETAWD